MSMLICISEISTNFPIFRLSFCGSVNQWIRSLVFSFVFCMNLKCPFSHKRTYKKKKIKNLSLTHKFHSNNLFENERKTVFFLFIISIQINQESVEPPYDIKLNTKQFLANNPHVYIYIYIYKTFRNMSKHFEA